MPNYNFYDVFYGSPLRFQQFACAVLSVREKCVFQRFGEGKDGGIDGLFVSGDERIILQVKRTEAKGKALLGILRGERQRLRPGQCSRYILVISTRSISDKWKKEIQKLLPEIVSTNDIITGEDLNGYLELPEYAHIEKAYHELWLNSGNYLETLLAKRMSADILKRSKVKLNLVAEEKRTFIETEIFAQALDILRAHQRVLISGEPGVGKTAHARCLADYCIQMDGYEELYFVNSIEEIEQILGEGNGRKIIIFDDFWGHGPFSESRIELNGERRMQELFRVLPYYPDVRLIFTTREFVLQQGLLHFPELEEVSRMNKVALRLDTYTLPQKAEILYRHLDAAELGYDYIKAIFERREDIIYCEAYSPRSVAYFLENVHAGGKSPREYAEMMVEYVKSPSVYFEKIFVQFSYGAKLICMLLVLSEEEIRVEPELKEEFMAVADACGDKVAKEEFVNYLRELEGAFTEIKPSSWAEETVLDFLNHSIRDFVNDYLKRNIRAYEMLFAEKCIYFNQLIYMSSELDLSQACRHRVMERLVSERNRLKYSFVWSMDVDRYYSVNAFSWEYEHNKIWQLYVQCRERHDPQLYQFLCAYCDRLIEKLYKNEIERSEMEAVANIIPAMCEMGWETDRQKLLRAYYENINWTADLDMMRYLRPCCPEYFDEFTSGHFEEIQKRLPGLILQDIEYYLDEWDGEERIDDLMDDAPLLFKEYGMEYSEEFEQLMYESAERERPSKGRYKTSIPRAVKREAAKYKAERQNYKAAEKQAEEWLLPRIKYLSSRKIKEIQRAMGKDYRRGWLTKGAFTEDDFMLVMDYLETQKAVPRREDVFYRGLIQFLTEEWSPHEVQALCKIARNLIEKDDFYFTEKEAAQYCGTVQGLPEKMSACGIVRRTGRWLHFWNRTFMLYLAARSVRDMDEHEKEQYYGEELWENWESARESGWTAYLADNDREALIRYLAAPCFSRYLEKIPGRSRQTREEWLMRQMQWEWQIVNDGGPHRRIITAAAVLKVLEVLEELECSIKDDAYDAFQETGEEGMNKGWLRSFGKEESGSIWVEAVDLLASKAGRGILIEKGCFDAVGKILDVMVQYAADHHRM